MATSTDLRVVFETSGGTEKTITIADVDPEVATSNIKAFINGVVSNSATLFKVTFTGASSALLRTTTDTEVDIES